MKSLDNLNYYEILKIPVNASFIEIKRAYRDALSIYSEDSLATYSLFSKDERDNILKVIEKAFLTLIDENKRAIYDKELVEYGQINELITRKDQNKTIPFFHTDNFVNDENLIDPIHGVRSKVRSAYRQEIIHTIDKYRKKIKNQRIDRQGIKNLHKLLQMREKVHESRNLSEIEQELLTISEDIEEPSLRMQRNISIVIFSYTLIALASFILLNITDAIMLHSFKIPYTVLLMGLVGCLVRMYLQLPNIRIRQPLSYNPIVWVIISPPIAVIMAGIFFGILKIFLPLIQVDLYDESWLFWVQAWVVGFVNWLYFFSKILIDRS
ncbi:MAG: DnaJ domain-containing protein [Deltaproteobacteria bacterium]|nr:MAG: DnaJ domain-containing protein [Deltaproteobacteria bacterium]